MLKQGELSQTPSRCDIIIDKSKETALEVVSSEKSYIHSLKTTIRAFQTRLVTLNEISKRRSILTNEEIESIFLNITNVYAIQKAFYEDIKAMRLHGSDYLVANIHTPLLRLAPLLSAYSEYARRQFEANTILQRLRHKNTNLQDLLTLTETAEGTTLEMLLIQPVQRVPRYILLIREMLRHVRKEETRGHLQEALLAMEHAASDMNLTIKHHEIHAELVRLEEMFQMRIGLVKPGRFLVKQGTLRKSFGALDGKSMFSGTLDRRSLVLLFNDMLLCASDSQIGQSRMRFAIPLHLLKVVDQGPPNFRIVSPARDMMFAAESDNEAQDWMHRINLHITSFIDNPDLEKRSTEAELEFTLKRNPAKMSDIVIMNQYMEHVVSNEDSLNAASSAGIASGAFQPLQTAGIRRQPSSASSGVTSLSPRSIDSTESSPRDAPPLSLSLAKIPETSQSPLPQHSMELPSMAPTGSSGFSGTQQSGVQETTMQGYLSKRGDGIKTWKKRFFVADSQFKLLRYFKDEESSKKATEALGFVDLDGCVVLPDDDNRWGPHAFEVYPQTSDRCYMLIAEDSESCISWMAFLKQFGNKDRFAEGYLLKKGAVLTGWKMRYFVCLQSVKELLYFKSQSDSAGPTMFSKALGTIHLKGCTIRESSAESKALHNKGNSVFEIHSSANADEKVKEWMSSSVQSKPSKTYVMAATDNQTMARWILLLTIAIGSSPQENEQRLPLHTIADLDDDV